MPESFKISRRDFIKASAVTGTGLALGISLASCSETSRTNDGSGSVLFSPNAWVKINTDNTIIVVVSESEMGQGVTTSIPMLVAEELEVNWETINFELAPVDPSFGRQYTGGSTSIREGWGKFRKAGAIARDMLITAAAQKWDVPEKQCSPQNGSIIHKSSGRSLTYGALADAAAKLPVPKIALLKDKKDFRIIGTPMPLLDIREKITGTAIFGSDIKRPDMLTATVTHSPVFGGSLKSYDDSSARKIKGVRDIVEIKSGVAIVADNFWAAKKGQAALKIEWNLGKQKSENNLNLLEYYKKQIDQPATTIRETGDAESALKNSLNSIEATYSSPFQAHATMEPMNCTADVSGSTFNIWVPTQYPTKAWKTAKKYTISKSRRFFEKVKNKLGGSVKDGSNIYSTFLGGGFGRRLKTDYVAEAVQISKAVKRPVKLQWTREEDIQHDFYRPATYHKLVAGLDKKGLPVSWVHTIVGPSKGKSTGGATRLPYSIPNFKLDYIKGKTLVPVGSWRSVGSSQNAFVTESFIDELAYKAKQNPLDYRLMLIKDDPRHKAVLKLAAEKSGWGRIKNTNRFHGIALHYSYGSYVAQVAEISISPTKEIIVHKITCAIDCGMVVNPDTIRAQMEGGIIFGLTATLKSAITVKNGRVEQSNFHDFPLIRIDETPQIDVHIIADSDLPGGVGEPGVPPIAPAVANAVFAATGIRVRKLPVLPSDLNSA